MCISKKRQIACALLFVVMCCQNSAAQTIPVQSSQAPFKAVRRDVDMPASRVPYVKDSLTRLFQKYVRIDPANASKIELQLSAGRADFEFLDAENRLRIVGPEPLANDLATLVATLAKLRADEAVRILPLHDNGQASLTKFSLAAVPLQKNPMRLAAMQQAVPQEVPSNSAPANGSRSDEPPKQDKPSNSLSLPQFEGAVTAYPSALVLAQLGTTRPANVGGEMTLQPIYLRDPHITIPAKTASLITNLK